MSEVAIRTEALPCATSTLERGNAAEVDFKLTSVGRVLHLCAVRERARPARTVFDGPVTTRVRDVNELKRARTSARLASHSYAFAMWSIIRLDSASGMTFARSRDSFTRSRHRSGLSKRLAIRIVPSDCAVRDNVATHPLVPVSKHDFLARFRTQRFFLSRSPHWEMSVLRRLGSPRVGASLAMLGCTWMVTNKPNTDDHNRLGNHPEARCAHCECLVRFVGPLLRRHVNEMNFGIGVFADQNWSA